MDKGPFDSLIFYQDLTQQTNFDMGLMFFISRRTDQPKSQISGNFLKSMPKVKKTKAK